MANRLAQESSPYLLQHKDNPVDWYPWGEEALGRARTEDKPILLSIGYSACHWCHVMAHESFENPGIAGIMNENFVNIKVDREERPDLDHIYQNVAQAMTRSGGWPLTVFLTPELKPFFGGTYFPPEDRWGRPGFSRVLLALAQAYRGDRPAVAANASKLTEFIASLELTEARGATGAPTRDALVASAKALRGAVDWAEGGFGSAPKFPNPMLLDFLLRHGTAFRSEESISAVLLSLTKMASGGIYDQLGGGFHRYSVDDTWGVPHFEKMLYDNGLLLKLYSQALLSRHPMIRNDQQELYKNILRDSVDYLLNEMRSPEGAFYAAQDADSEGEEGKYFVWDPDDLARHLGSEEARVFAARYGVTEAGNFEHGKTVLRLAVDVGSPDERMLLASARRKLREARSRRVPPGTDTKMLASWNGLAISGLSWAARALAEFGEAETAKRAASAARGAFDFIRVKFSREGEGWRLYSTFQGDRPKLNAYLDDYAFMAMAALDLARFEPDDRRIEALLEAAEGWTDAVLEHFGDPNAPGRGYFFTSDDHEALIQRPRTTYDQAIPSGTGVMIHCLLALEEIDRGGRGERYGTEARRQLGGLWPAVEKSPQGHGELLNTALLELSGPIVVSGRGSEALCDRPQAFRRPAEPSQGDRLLVCHRRSCGPPHAGIEDARREIESKVLVE